MAKCVHCGKGINSTYVREGSKGVIRKVGYYCSDCDTYYDSASEKLYTVNGKTVYSNKAKELEEQSMTEKLSVKEQPWPGFGPGTFALPRLGLIFSLVLTSSTGPVSKSVPRLLSD
jgi:hypothetical protein